MAIGERIKFFRTLRGMTQNYLGQKTGFSKQSADARIAQYENGSRSPKKDVVEQLSQALDISPHALTSPDIDSYVGVMHTLFAIEDLYGVQIGELNDEVCLRLDKSRGLAYVTMFKMFTEWKEIHQKYEDGEITKEEYDQWRYKYPESITKKFD